VRILFRSFALFAEAFYSEANAADYFDGFSSRPAWWGSVRHPFRFNNYSSKLNL
jgi:hypothetical protein